jgi:hypothetical protein
VETMDFLTIGRFGLLNPLLVLVLCFSVTTIILPDFRKTLEICTYTQWPK